MEIVRDFDSFYELIEHFDSEETCKDHLEKVRWNGNPVCPHCGHEHVYVLNLTGQKNKYWKCADCRKKFTVTVGTIFHNSKISLRKWFIAIYLITSHKKGISSHQLARDLKITQKTAWFILHRVREAFTPNKNEVFSNEVEIDETFIGGKEKNKHKSKRTPNTQGRSTKTKIAVLGIYERNGKVYALPVADTKRETLLPIMVEKVEAGSTVYTDEHRPYKALRGSYIHEVVTHGADEFVRGAAHTNNIECFWSHLKRGIDGIYHHVSDKHIDRYVNEFAYRFNNRDFSEGSRFDVLLGNSSVRLSYKQLING